jgi:aminoglycoside phosphotransferase (APT) family kinase protein
MLLGTPVAETTIDQHLVRSLLREQHPDLAHEEIRWLDTGWDNAMYRVGESYVARLPRRQLAVSLAGHEQTWLPVLAKRLPIPIPVPVRIGKPTDDYPWPWSIVRWIPGNTAIHDPLRGDQSYRLAEFLLALHRPAPSNAPKNDWRGVPLRQRVNTVSGRLQRLRSTSNSITPEIDRVWQQALDAPETRESFWLHGDLHARNVLVTAGVISGIIDWGDITSGDAATDVASVWMLFADPESRHDVLSHYGASPELVARAKGWAIVFGTALLETGLVDDPRHAAMGAATLQRVTEDS